ncbi:polysaccharide deacetylase family protein [Asticcacaulis sp. EMRT-3]|uniref:polysaccharide deacetylase family protein n=1 Tax=Asticcacaulis sp. EMRT-3 TaxID=3040349 RepID=UPI0024AFE456|nr:polysaccharide deacetylase family protein [Asticcacaulis sp. EMRT-3]MDI7773932.1 polysaccharide deacetylase family protein [Asticcacaulis sp. EMRT-3]
MKIPLVKLAVSAATLLSLLALPAYAAAPGFDIAITVDDLPAHGSLPQGTTRVAIAREIIAALKAHGVPQAYGFVNAIHIEQEPDSAPVLDLWRQAGFPLGNHTYSHPNIRQIGVDAFLKDLARGEPVVAAHMQGQDWKWLRFPYLSAGEGADHQVLMNYLHAHDYHIADVSMSFSDWAYTESYNRCLAKGDTAAIKGLEARYMEGVRTELTRMPVLSQTVYGRQIPIVLLTHIGGFSAVMLPQVLDELDKAGAHYVTLQQAESDPAYAEDDPHAGDGSLMERTAMEKGIDLSHVPAGASLDGIDKVCN